MSEKQKILTYELDGQEISITVQRATARIGVKRFLLGSQAVKDNETEPDEALRILRLIVFPNVVSATVEIDGMEMPTFDQFADLPEELVEAWSQAVYDVNPQWKAPEGEPKNESTSKKG
jgi:hypothetical protein